MIVGKCHDVIGIEGAISGAKTFAEIQRKVTDHCAKKQLIAVLKREGWTFTATEEHRDPKLEFAKSLCEWCWSESS